MSAELVESMFSRATGAGIDPHDYRRTCADIATPADWAPACAVAAERFRAAAALYGPQLSQRRSPLLPEVRIC